MFFKKVFSSAVFAALLGSSFGNQAKAHSTLPLFSAKNSAIVTNKQLHVALSHSVGIHLSGSQQSFKNIESLYTGAGRLAGAANGSTAGGTVIGGNITGTGYQDSGPGTAYQYFGQGSITLANGPGTSANSIIFVSNAQPINPINMNSIRIPTEIGGIHLSGTTRQFLTLTTKSFYGGYNSAVSGYSGPIVGGQVGGAYYYPIFGGSPINLGNKFFVAFGNDSYNVVNGAPPSNAASFITFANGQTRQIAAGQISLSGALVDPPNSVYGPQAPGAVGAFGSDPFNVEQYGIVLTAIKNYIIFK